MPVFAHERAARQRRRSENEREDELQQRIRDLDARGNHGGIGNGKRGESHKLVFLVCSKKTMAQALTQLQLNLSELYEEHDNALSLSDEYKDAGPEDAIDPDPMFYRTLPSLGTDGSSFFRHCHQQSSSCLFRRRAIDMSPKFSAALIFLTNQSIWSTGGCATGGAAGCIAINALECAGVMLALQYDR